MAGSVGTLASPLDGMSLCSCCTFYDGQYCHCVPRTPCWPCGSVSQSEALESTCDVVALVVYYKCGPPRPVSDPLERGFNFLYYASPHLIFMGLVSSFPSFLFSVVTSLERSSLITLSKIALLAPPLGLLPSPLTCFSS